MWSSFRNMVLAWFHGHKQFVAEFSITCVFLLWGMNYNIIKFCLQYTSSFMFCSLDYLFGLLVVFSVLYKHIKLRFLRASIIVGVSMCFTTVLQVYALQNTMVGKTAFYATLDIPLTAIIESLFFRSISMNEKIGVICSVLGAFLLSYNESTSSLSPNFGDWLSILACIPSSIYFISCSYYSNQDSKASLCMGQLLISSILCAIISPIVETPKIDIGWPLLGGLIITGCLSCGIALFVLTWAQIYTTPTRAVIIGAPEPVFAAFVAYILYGEVFESYINLLGCVLMILGILSPVLFFYLFPEKQKQNNNDNSINNSHTNKSNEKSDTEDILGIESPSKTSRSTPVYSIVATQDTAYDNHNYYNDNIDKIDEDGYYVAFTPDTPMNSFSHRINWFSTTRYSNNINNNTTNTNNNNSIHNNIELSSSSAVSREEGTTSLLSFFPAPSIQPEDSHNGNHQDTHSTSTSSPMKRRLEFLSKTLKRTQNGLFQSVSSLFPTPTGDDIAIPSSLPGALSGLNGMLFSRVPLTDGEEELDGQDTSIDVSLSPYVPPNIANREDGVNDEM